MSSKMGNLCFSPLITFIDTYKLYVKQYFGGAFMNTRERKFTAVLTLRVPEAYMGRLEEVRRKMGARSIAEVVRLSIEKTFSEVLNHEKATVQTADWE